MIGYYVHHHGRGHLHRAVAVAREVGQVVGLSSLPRPAEWVGPWVDLPRDDEGLTQIDVEAGGRLHWVPEHDDGLRSRMSEISSWIKDLEPDLMVVDVSVEVSLLARLHGVPVVTTVLPGDRRDPAHELVHAMARTTMAPWPGQAHGVLRTAVPPRHLRTVGAFSRFDGRPLVQTETTARPRVLMMLGAGGHEIPDDHVAAAMAQTPDWEWQVIGGDGDWVEDPWDALCAADVVVTHAGQNAIAEVAASRTPAVVLPQRRPFGEQDMLAAALAVSHEWPAVVRSVFPTHGWAELLEEAVALDGAAWSTWNDGEGAKRAAEVVRDALDRPPGQAWA